MCTSLVAGATSASQLNIFKFKFLEYRFISLLEILKVIEKASNKFGN